MIYSQNLTMEKKIGEIYLTHKEKYHMFPFNDIDSLKFKNELMKWTVKNQINLKYMDLILSFTELKFYQIEIPKYEGYRRSKIIERILDSCEFYDKDKDNLSIISYIYKKSERLLFVMVEKQKIEEEKKDLKKLGYKLGNVDADFNMIPYCIPMGLEIEKYIYIGIGKNYVGVVIYNKFEIIDLKNIKLKDENMEIKEMVLLIKPYLNDMLIKMNYTLDLIVVRNSIIKNEIMGIFESKVMTIDELKYLMFEIYYD